MIQVNSNNLVVVNDECENYVIRPTYILFIVHGSSESMIFQVIVTNLT